MTAALGEVTFLSEKHRLVNGIDKDCIYLALISIGQPIQFSTTAIAGEAHDIYSGSSPMFMAAGSNWATADAVPLLFILIWINST